MPLPASLDVYMAMVFFHAYIYGPLRGKARLYRDRGIHARVAMSEDWEVFASILVRDTGTSTAAGLDLEGSKSSRRKTLGPSNTSTIGIRGKKNSTQTGLQVTSLSSTGTNCGM